MLVHRRFQLRKKNMLAMKEPTYTFSIRVPPSLHRLLRKRAKELKVSQNRLVLEGLRARLGDSADASTSNTGRKDSSNRS